MKTAPCPHLRFINGVFLAAGFAFLTLPPSTALAANVTWSGTTTGDWAVGSNWVGGNAPVDNTTTDDAYFTGTGDYTVSLTANRSARRLYVTGTANPIFDFGDYTLSLGSLLNIQGGNASLTSGAISLTQWYHGNRNSNAAFTLDGGTASVTTSGSGHVGYSDSTQNSNANTLAIKNGAEFSAGSTFNIGWVAAAASANVTANDNKLEVTGPGSTFSSTGISMGYIHGGSNTGRTANNNSIVINNGGELSTQLLYVGREAPATPGTGTSTGNTVTIGGTGTGSVLTLVPSGSNPALHIGFGGATNNIITVNAGGAIEADGTNLRVYSATGNVLRVFGGEIRNAGTISVEGKMFLGAGGSVTANLINVTASGRFGDKSDAATAGFTSGTLVLGEMTYNPAVMFSVGDNSGTTPAVYQMAGGLHRFGGGITIEESEGRLTGNGTIQALAGGDTTLTVNGMLSPGNSTGTINLTGDLVSGENAVFNFEIASLADFDQLNITGTAAFDGTLNISLLNDYAPELGNSFDLFGFQTSSGSFATLNLPALGGGLSWDDSDLYTTGVLSVIPEPSTLGLLVACGIGLATLRRRRTGNCAKFIK